jgi:hypothetical protein
MFRDLRSGFKMILALGVLLILNSGSFAQDQGLILTPKDNGRTIRVDLGQTFTVQLDLSGDSHVVAPEFNPMVLTIVGQSLQSTSGPQGSRVRVVYTFAAHKEGQTDVVISVKRGPSGAVRPLLRVNILVGGGTGV